VDLVFLVIILELVDFSRPAIPLGLVDEVSKGMVPSARYTTGFVTPSAAETVGVITASTSVDVDDKHMIVPSEAVPDEEVAPETTTIASVKIKKRKRSVQLNLSRRKPNHSTAVDAGGGEDSDAAVDAGPPEEQEIESSEHKNEQAKKEPEPKPEPEPEPEPEPTEVGVLLSKAMELFLLEMGTEAWRCSRNMASEHGFQNNVLEPSHIVAAVDRRDHFDFLCPATSVWLRNRELDRLEAACAVGEAKARAEISDCPLHI
jgi:hypothetical protein